VSRYAGLGRSSGTVVGNRFYAWFLKSIQKLGELLSEAGLEIER
jgi:hypothetical protein